MVDEFQKLLELQADSIADIPLRVPFDIHDHSMLPGDFPMETKREYLKKWRWPWVKAKIKKRPLFTVKRSTSIVIEPQKVGTFFRFSTLLSKIQHEDLEKITVDQERDFDVSAPEAIAKYGPVIVEIICVGIHNRKGAFPEYMPEFIRENCTWKDLHFFLNAILFRIGTMAFTNSTTLLKKVGPRAAEKIALQKNLTSWQKN